MHSDMVRCLDINEKKLEVFTAATQEELDAIWSVFLAIYKEFHLIYTDSICIEHLGPHLVEFLALCWRQRHCF